jgi:pimeloyl-ACP methyl ester carboxylesterase
MIDYYRESVRQSPHAEAQLRAGQELAEPDRDDVPNLDRVERLPDASHCVQHDEPERVTQLLIDFFAPGRST